MQRDFEIESLHSAVLLDVASASDMALLEAFLRFATNPISLWTFGGQIRAAHEFFEDKSDQFMDFSRIIMRDFAHHRIQARGQYLSSALT